MGSKQFEGRVKVKDLPDDKQPDFSGYMLRVLYSTEAPWIVASGDKVTKVSGGFTAKAPQSVSGASLLIASVQSEVPEDLTGYMILAPRSKTAEVGQNQWYLPVDSAVIVPSNEFGQDHNKKATPATATSTLNQAGEFSVDLVDVLEEERGMVLISDASGHALQIWDGQRMVMQREIKWDSAAREEVEIAETPRAEVPKVSEPTLKEIKGRVIALNGSQQAIPPGSTVMIWGREKAEGPWILITEAKTDTHGYFTVSQVEQELYRARGIVTVHREEDVKHKDKALSIDTWLENGTDIPLDKKKLPKSIVVGFLPPELDRGRSLESFDFYSLVRTSDPVIRGMTMPDFEDSAAAVPPAKVWPRFPEIISKGTSLLPRLVSRSRATDNERVSMLPPRWQTATYLATEVDRDDKIGSIAKEALWTEALKGRLAQMAVRSGATARAPLGSSSVRLEPNRLPGSVSSGLRLDREVLAYANRIDWDDTPTMYQATTVAHGHLLHYKQTWRANGYSKGDVLYSLPLAPCQTRHIVTIDWDRRETAARTEGVTEAEQIAATLSRDRDVSEIVNVALNESIRGGSTAKSSAVSGGLGIAGSIGGAGKALGGVIGVAGGSSKSKSEAWQKSSRSLAAAEVQRLTDVTQQAASAIRSRRATVITEAGQGETIGVETTAVTNHNHCHAMTVQYFEVLRHFLVQTELVGVQECLFVPLIMSAFTAEKALRWRGVLESLVPRNLHPAFGALERIDDHWEHSDYPQGSFAEEPLVYLDGELRIRLVVARPPDSAKSWDELVESDPLPGWDLFAPLFGLSPLGLYQRYRRYQEQRDRYFDEVLAPALAREYVEGLKVHLTGSTRTRWSADLDVTLVTGYKRTTGARLGERLRPEPTVYVKFRPSGSSIRARKIPREQIDQLEITANKPLPEGSRAVVEMAQFRYRTDHFEASLFSSNSVLDDLVDDTVVLPVFLSREERRNPRHEDADLALRLVRHLNDNLEPYHRALWLNMDSERRYMMLDGYLAPGEEGLSRRRSLASVVENQPIAIIGNSMVFPVAPGFMLDPILRNAVSKTRAAEDRNSAEELLELYKPLVLEPADEVSVPTRGVFAEATLGEDNSCEFIDDRRFWRWSQEPCTDSVTPILPVDTASRRFAPESTQPSQIGTVLNLQAAPSAPDPTGLGAAIAAGAREFAGAMGLEKTQASNQAAFAQTTAAAQAYGQQASALAQQAQQMKRPSPSETSQTLRQIDEVEAAEGLPDGAAKDMRRRALDSAVGPVDPNSTRGVMDKLVTIKDAVKSGAITDDQRTELAAGALRRMVDDGQSGLLGQPQVASLLASAKDMSVEAQSGGQYLKVSTQAPLQPDPDKKANEEKDAKKEWDTYATMKCPQDTEAEFGWHFPEGYASYKKVRRVLIDQGRTNPAKFLKEFLDKYVKKTKFRGKTCYVHTDLVDKLKSADASLGVAANKHIVEALAIRLNENNSSEVTVHAYGMGIDIDRKLNPNIKDPKDKLVIKAVTGCDLGVKQDYDTLKAASDKFKSDFSDAWINNYAGADKSAVQKAIDARKIELEGYRENGFLNLPKDLVVELTEKQQLIWGGYFKCLKDFMHFELAKAKTDN